MGGMQMLPEILRFRRLGKLLWLVLLLGQCFISVNASSFNLTVQSLTQSPGNPVVVGNAVTYSITVSSPDVQTDIEIDIGADGKVFTGFTNTVGGCSQDGPQFFCGPIPQGGAQTYSFQATTISLALSSPVTFNVTCNGCTSQQVQMNPATQVGPPGLTGNETSIEGVLGTACQALPGVNDPSEGQVKLNDICVDLAGENPAALATSIQQITPAQMPGQVNLSFQSSNTQLENLTERMTTLRSGSGGNSMSGLSLQYAGLTLPAELLFGRQDQVALGVEPGIETPGLVPTFGIYVIGSVSFGEKDDTADELGFDFNTGGVTVGADYRFNDSLIAGGAVGYVDSDSDFNGSRGDVDVRGISFLGYSTYYFSETSYLEAVLGFGGSKYNNTRKVTIGSTTSKVEGDTDGTETTISLGAGYDFARGPLLFNPYGKINYIRTEIDGYSENTNTGLELEYDHQDSKSLSSLVGGQLSYAISKQYGVFLPTLRVDWVHEFKDDSRFITGSFVNDPTNGRFNIKTDNPDRNYFLLGLGVAATFRDNRSAFFNYEYLLDQDDLEQKSLTAGFRMDF
jgi:outer membrane autotransporter protein